MNNVYVFGAGASKHVGGPLTCSFLLEGFSSRCFDSCGDMPDIPAESAAKFERVAELVDLLYGSEISSALGNAVNDGCLRFCPSAMPACTVEDLLTFVDLAVANEESWLPFDEYQAALHDFIFETLDYTTRMHYSDSLKTNTDGTLDHRRNCYDRLIDYRISLEDQNCFITFNYDLFLDEAVSINNHDLLGDYNLRFAEVHYFPDYRERFLEGNRLSKDVDILKLHGSLNWSRCSVCNALFLAYHDTYKAVRKRQCPTCGRSLKPVLVPPTHRKELEGYGIGRIWEKAAESIERADTITVIGYSFPDADIEAKWLFKSSVARGGKKPKLVLVDPSRSTRLRIAGLFAKTVREGPEFECFEQFCESNVTATAKSSAF
ncbi:MAG: SIR2 family protein [Planctomycetes bacterium]|nr:SIR2 family protein [Planctomycetota bacterium]